MDPNDAFCSMVFTEAELQEISATVCADHVTCRGSREDEECLLAMKKLVELAGRGLTLSTLQDIADQFMSNFKDVIYRQLLVWINESGRSLPNQWVLAREFGRHRYIYSFLSLGNVVWLCEQAQCSRSPSGPYLGHNSWTLTLDRAHSKVKLSL